MSATQHSLRRHTALYAMLLIVVHFMMFFYMRDSTAKSIEYQLHQEMLMRVTYVSALASWVPLENLVSLNIFDSVTDNSAFLLNVYTREDSPVGVTNMKVVTNSTITVYMYNPDLDAVLELQAEEVTPTTTGCNEEFLAVTMCVVLLIPLVLLTTLGIANLVARGGRPTIAKVVVWIGYVAVPCGISVGYVALLAYIQETSSLNGWEKDIRRSAELYAVMFDAMRKVLATSNAALLSSTLASVNEQVYDEYEYQVVLAQGKAKTIVPPLKSRAVEMALFARADKDHVELSGRVDGYTYAGSSVSSIASLLLVVRSNGAAPSLGDDQYLLVMMVLVGMTLVFGGVLLFARYPFSALGQLSELPIGVSPWENRLTPYWPYTKLIELLALITVVVMVLCMSLNRLTMMYHRTDALKQVYDVRINAIENLQMVSDLFAKCYAGVVGGVDWSLDYVDRSTQTVSYTGTMALGSFYAHLLEKFQSERYFHYSLLDAVLAEPEELWPLLSNAESLAEILNSAVTGMDVLAFQHWVGRTEGMFFQGLLRADSSWIRYGDPVVLAGLESSYTAIQDHFEMSVEDFMTNVRVVIASGERFAAIGDALASQKVSTQDYVNLYSSPEGQKVMKIESYVLNNEQEEVPNSTFMNLTYGWTAFTSLYVLYTAVGLTLMALLFDVFYTASFFGGLPVWVLRRLILSTRAAVVPKKVLVNRNDYTAPNAFAHVDVHAMQQSMKRLLICIAALIGWTLTIVLAFHLQVSHSMNFVVDEVEYFKAYIMPLAKRAEKSAVIEMSLAAWVRAYLSLTPDSVNEAIRLTSTWMNMRVITWNGMTADQDPTRVQSSVMRQIFELTRLASVQISGMRDGELQVDGVYSDFVELVKHFDAYVHFPGYDTCMSYVLATWETNVNGFLMCLSTPDDPSCYAGKMAAMNALSAMCGAKVPADFRVYLARLEAIRRRSWTAGMDHAVLSSNVVEATANASYQVDEMIVTLRNKFADMSLTTDLVVPWMILFYVWLASPLVYLTYRFTAQIHASIYYG